MTATLQQQPLKILIVDDNEASAQTLGWMMELFGYAVQLAFNGASALQAAATLKPDVVFLDIGLPGMNGYDVCGEMQKILDKDTIFIAQTGWSDSKYHQRSKELGFQHHLVKPIDMSQLQLLMETLDRQRQPADNNKKNIIPGAACA